MNLMLAAAAWMQRLRTRMAGTSALLTDQKNEQQS
jgi:hypothetical protein